MKRTTVLLCLAGMLEAQAPSGWVALPVAEFNALRAKAAPPGPDPLPVSAAVTSLEYDLTLARETLAAGRIRLVVDVLHDGWAQIPLPAGLAVSGAALPVGCRLTEGGIAFPGRGRFEVRLDGMLPVTVSGGQQRLAVPSSPAGITRVSLGPVRPGTEMTVTGGVLSETSTAAWTVHANGPDPLIVAWRRKSEEPREALPLRQSGSLVQLWTLGEDASSLSAEMTLDVQQGVSRQLIFDLPEGLTVNQVLGANVADWSASGGALTVSFLETATRQSRFLIQAEAKLARAGELKLPLLKARGLEREQGGVAVELAGAAEIRASTPVGLESASAAQIGGIAAARQSPSLSAFRYLPSGSARSLAVQVSRYDPVAMLSANIDESRADVLLASDGKMLVRARYAVRNSQRSFMKMKLPEGAVLWSAALGGRPVRPGQGPENSLMFALSKPSGAEEAPAILAEVTYLARSSAWSGRGSATLVLPKLDLPVSRSGVTVYLPANFRVTPEPGTFRTGAFVPPQSPAFRFPAARVSPAAFSAEDKAAANSQVLVDRYLAKRDARQPEPAANQVDFPGYGSSIFLTAELTAENQEPRIALNYQPNQKGDGK